MTFKEWWAAQFPAGAPSTALFANLRNFARAAWGARQAEVDRLAVELNGAEKARALLLRGMERQAEINDELKQRVRTLEAGILEARMMHCHSSKPETCRITAALAALLAPAPAAPAAERGLCPDCGGLGWRSAPAQTHRGEALLGAKSPCLKCDGTGLARSAAPAEGGGR